MTAIRKTSDGHNPAAEFARLSRGTVQYVYHGSGPVVLALHGSPGGCDQSLTLYGDLLNSGYSLLAPSRPGYLGTSLETGITIAEQADSFVELIDHLGIKDFFIAAYSCGAPTAVRLAAEYPERVKGLILECPVTRSFRHKMTRGLHGNLLFSDLGSWILRKLISHAPLYAVKRALERESTFGPGLHNEAYKIFKDEYRRQIALRVLGYCQPASKRLPGLINDAKHVRHFTNEDLERVRCSTLIIHGLADKEVPFAQAEYTAARLRDATLMPIPGASHLLCVSERWGLIKRARIQFLNSLVEKASGIVISRFSKHNDIGSDS